MPEGATDQGARWGRPVRAIGPRTGRQSPGEERRPKIYRDRREPDHKCTE